MTSRDSRSVAGRATAALMVGSFALFSWGCGNDDNDFVVGGVFPSPSVAPTVFPSIIPSNVVTLSGATVPAGATSAQVRLLGANGQLITTVPATINANGTITFTVPSGVTGFTQAQVLFFNAQGQVIGSAPTTALTPGQTTGTISGATNTSSLTAVTVSAGSANTTIAPGGTLPLTVSGTYSTGGSTVGPFVVTGATFTSSNASVANVSSTGVVTGIAAGTTTITATLANPAGGNTSGTIQVTVTGGAASPTPTPTPSATPTPTPTSSPSPSASPSQGQLILSTTNATTVVGGNVVVSGTINGVAQNITLAVGNTGVASVSGSGTTSATLTGVATGATNFTATAGGQSVQGNITVADGTLTSTLVISPGTALTVNEGDQRQFRAFAQFGTPQGQTVQTDVTNQCLWVVTNTTNQNLGEAISFDAGAGNFTATRGNAGTVQVGAIFSNPSGVAIGNTSVTINRTNPTITIRPVLSAETTGSRLPVGGWSRLFETVATYPSGYSKTLAGADVAYTNTSSPSVNSLNAFPTGRAELVSAVTGPGQQPGQITLSATYTNSLSGLAGGNHTVGLISYTLQNVTGGFAPTLPNDLKVIPGRGVAANGYVRPILVTANFQDKNAAGNNLVMPLFTNPLLANAAKPGAISLYLNPGAFPAGTAAFNGSFAAQRVGTDATVQLLTSAITPVAYTHLLRNVTTGLYNQNVLNIRVQYHPVTTGAPTLASVGNLSNSTSGLVADIVGSSAAVGGDRDVARTASISNVTIDGASSLTLTVANPNLRRGQATNATLRAQYVGVGGAQEDVTQLADYFISSSSPTGLRVGNITNGIGEVKARVSNAATIGSGAGQGVVTSRYPFVQGAATNLANVTVNITLP